VGGLVGQVDELRNGDSLVVDFLRRKPLPCVTCSHAGSPQPETVSPDVIEGTHLARGLPEAEGWLPVVEESG
jgi:hypothetical protein